MLTEEAERRLRKEWGDENNRTMEEAYNLLFPDLNLRTCYSLNDFKDDYADWKKDLPTPPPNLINLDDAIKFLGDNQ